MASETTSRTLAVQQRVEDREGVGLQSHGVRSVKIKIRVPSWLWAELRGLYGKDEGILKYVVNGDFETIVSADGYNRLCRLSYGLVRYWRSYKRFTRLVPFLKTVENVSDEVADKLRFNGAILVLGVPRSGKSTGSEWGIMRWIVEKNVSNYVVIVITPNRRLVQLYKNAVGFWVKMLNDLSYRALKLL